MIGKSSDLDQTGEDADALSEYEVSADIAQFPEKATDQLDADELKLWLLQDLRTIQSDDPNWILTSLPIVRKYCQQLMSKRLLEAKQISLDEVFGRFRIANLRFQSHYGEEEENPDDGNDIVVPRTESTSDEEGEISSILDPSLSGDEITDQLSKEVFADDSLQDDGVSPKGFTVI
jgi:hypothetical protein